MDEKEVVIQLSNISKRYKLYKSKVDRLKESLHPLRKVFHRDFYALENINLEVRKGEILGIIGRNGSGKSTLLKIISGILTPSNGQVFTQGKIVPLLELGSGFNPEFTGIENIFFYSSLMGFSRKDMEERIDQILEFAEIGDFIYQPLKTYSSGMKARLAFAVSVNIDPDILILDEVLSVGDELFRRKCFAKMETFFKAGKTILYVSHSISSVNLLCSRAILIDKGQVLANGIPKMITSIYQKMIFSKIISHDLLVRQIQKDITDYNIQVNENLKNDFKFNYELSRNSVKNYPLKDYFIDGLNPKSTVEYIDSKVEFSLIGIFSLDGRRVNALVSGMTYIYQYNVLFLENLKDISFGMQIKTEQGQMLVGATIPDHLDLLATRLDFNKTDRVTIKWKFIANLLLGTYYLNCGVSSTVGEKLIFYGRIIDASVFKIVESPVGIYGIADCAIEMNIDMINVNY
ncbi:MAG: ABC transporter ATP-binding protein [Bacteroidetes bacterium]|nr:ABC transporter ATP-binding protein [Bacteroidota bacterium]